MIPLFISLSIRNLIKNKRNTLSIAIGLFIALSLISAINFNINNSRTELILQSSNIDFSLHAAFSKPNSGFKNFLNDTETWKKIASESEVSSVVPYTTGYRT